MQRCCTVTRMSDRADDEYTYSVCSHATEEQVPNSNCFHSSVEERVLNRIQHPDTHAVGRSKLPESITFLPFMVLYTLPPCPPWLSVISSLPPFRTIVPTQKGDLEGHGGSPFPRTPGIEPTLSFCWLCRPRWVAVRRPFESGTVIRAGWQSGFLFRRMAAQPIGSGRSWCLR
jgi:hypothetical protein